MENQNQTIKIIPTTGRNNCGGRCVIYAHVQGEQVIKLTTTDDPDMKACMRGLQYHKSFLNNQRLLYPMKRVGKRGEGKFVRITWEEAITQICNEMIRIKDAYGAASRYVNYGWGYSAAIQPGRLAKRLLALDGGYLDYYNSYSDGATNYATPYTYGTNETGNSPADLVHSKLIILWGHNPAETVFGTGTMAYLRQAKENGAKVIVIDPRQSDTVVTLADQWIALRPTTDCALMDAIAYILLEQGLYDQSFMDQYCIGHDQAHMPPGSEGQCSYFSYLQGQEDGIAKTAKWAEAICGVPEEVIIRLAQDYGQIKPAALIQGYAPQRQAYGEQFARGGAALAAMTGNIGVSGGWASGAGSCTKHRIAAIPSLENPFSGKIPCFLWTEAVRNGTAMTATQHGIKGVEQLPSNIKMIFNLAGNCLINQHSDINQTIAILQDETLCECIICSDLFMTPSAKFADILLPGVSMFEESNLANPWKYGDYIMKVNPVISPLGQCRMEYDWLKEVADVLQVGEAFREGNDTLEQWCQTLYERFASKQPDEMPSYEEFSRIGHYKWHSAPTIAFTQQVDPVAPIPFPTPSGKIEIYSQRLQQYQQPEQIPPIPKYIPAWEGPESVLYQQYPLQLIGWHSKRRTHSIFENNQQFEQAMPHGLWIHPEDAQCRGLVEGELVHVFNQRGTVQIPVQITPRIMKGVVAMPQGAWYTPGEDGVDQRGSINVLTSLTPTALAKSNTQQTILVQVRKIES